LAYLRRLPSFTGPGCQKSGRSFSSRPAGDYPLKALPRASEGTFAGGAFSPAPAEVFKALYGTHEDQATMAWCDVLEAIRRTGAEGPVKFADYRIHYAIERMGGWAHVALGRQRKEKMADEGFYHLVCLCPQDKRRRRRRKALFNGKQRDALQGRARGHSKDDA
jgi:hypothetical protein